MFRTKVRNDAINEIEANEGFRLIVRNTGGTDASGISYLNDDGSGVFLDASSALNPNALLDDDRTLNVSGGTYNEGSSFIQWTVTGAAGQRVLFAASPSGITADAVVGPSGDITTADLEYYNGSSWVAFDASSTAVLDGSGSLQVRTRVNNDAINEIEANEGFRLIVRNTGGTDASGISYLNDDGSGVFLDASGAVRPNALLDDDRTLNVSGGTYNEGSSFIQWTVTGAAGQRVLFAASPSGITADAVVGPSGDITSADLEYYNGSSWVAFDASSTAVLDSSGSLQVRTRVNNDAINETEANEGFRLIVRNTGGTDASGIAYLNDDGSGVFLDASGAVKPNALLDDDRPLTISNPSVNENSSYVVFRVTGAAHQELILALPSQGTGNSASQWDGSSNRDPYLGSSDYGPALEIWNGITWQPYLANSLARLDASGSLLVRTAIHDDFVYESGPSNDAETFRLIATNTGGVDASGGVASIFDDGTGLLFDPSGSPDSSGNPAVIIGDLDNDLQDVSVAGGTFNEGSDWAVFVVTGVIKEVNNGVERGYRLLVSDGTTQKIVDESLGDPSGQPLIKYSVDNGATWSIYLPGSIIASPGKTERVLVAVNIKPEQDVEYEFEEDFLLYAEDSGDTDVASGIAQIVDAGAGLRVSVDQSGNPIVDLSGNPIPLTTGFADDDRTLNVSGGTYNEGSSFIQWTVTGAAGQRVLFAASPSGITADAVVGPSGDITSADLEYYNGSSWVAFDASSTAVLDGSGSLQVRTRVNNDAINETEANEGFRLIVRNTGGTDASGISYLNDDGSGVFLDASGAVNPNALLDDDRTLNVSGATYNEASAFIQWTVTGAAGQRVLFSAVPVGISADALVGPSGDITAGDLQYFNGSTWLSFDASSNAVLDGSGSLLIRTRVNNDAINETEANEGFRLIIKNTGGTDASGISYLNDDGSGVILDPSGILDPNTPRDDDRTLNVSGGTYNEGSSFIQWTVTGAAGQRVLFAASPSGITADAVVGPSGDITSADLEYYNGSSWVAFDASSTAVLDGSGSLQVRTRVNNDAINETEANEGFRLIVRNTGGTDASGISYLNDDGSGVFLDASGAVKPNALLDDDRTLNVSGATYNEASAFIQWTVTGAAGQRVLFSAVPAGISADALVGPSGDITAADLQYFNGSTWLSFDASSNAVLDGSGSLLIRTRVNNDAINETEANEGCRLIIKNSGGTDASGISYLNDDGSGVILDSSGILDPNTPRDDDRTLNVSGGTYNEGSSFIQWTVTGAAGQRVLFAASPSGITADAVVGPSGDITSADLEYYNGSSWVAFDASSTAVLDGSGSLQVRTRVNNDAINEIEANEGFRLIVRNTGGTDASGISYLNDDGSGVFLDASGALNPNALLDDDRTLNVSGATYNEASAFIQWTVTGAAGQRVLFSAVPAGISADALVGPSGDITAADLQYFNGSTWLSFDASSNAVLDGSGSLLIRTRVNNDAINETEANEGFRLIVRNTGGTDASGISYLNDDGSGVFLDASGAVKPNALLDDDRTLNVSGGTYNEGSSFIQWTVTGAAGQRVLFAASPSGITADAVVGPSGDITSADLEYYNGSSWVAFDASSTAVLDGSGSLQVRTRVNNDAINEIEANEGFRLIVRNTGGTDASGISYLNDDGSGVLLDPSGNLDSSSVKDDDRTLTVSGATYNEASTHIFWTISGVAGQVVQRKGLSGDPSGTALPADPSGDLTGALEFRNSVGSWVSFDASGAALDASGSLLLRKAIVNDAVYEGKEEFRLAVAYVTGNKDASGVSSLIDDGTGLVVDGSGNPTAGNPDDDRSLTVSGATYNEASSHIFWTITGVAGQVVGLNSLAGDPSGTALPGDPSGDLTGALEYRNSDGNWESFDASGAELDASGVLLVRKSVNNDDRFEGEEDFVLSVGYISAGVFDVSGVSSLIDDGTGLLVDGSGNPTGGTLDDDSILIVNSVSVNEGSPNAVFTINGAVGQRVFLSIADASGTNPALDPSGGLAELGASPSLQYRDGSGIWQVYNVNNPPVITDLSGVLFARVAITAEQEAAFDGPEAFNLIAANSSGNSFLGTATIRDDGTGNYWVGDSSIPATSQQLEASRITLDDDRTLRVTAYSPVNEASIYAMFAVTAVPGQGLQLSLGNTSSLLDVDATISGFVTQWSLDGSSWTEGNSVPAVPDTGIVFVRVMIASEADDLFEGAEAFTQSATYATGAPLKATGISSIVDNGSGELYTGGFTGGQPGLIDGPLDDDRSALSIPDVNVNEASPYVVFQVSANAGQSFVLTLSDGAIGFTGQNDSAADRDRQQAVAGSDYQNSLEVYDGKVWTSYTPASLVRIPAGGSVLLVRVPLINDTLYEGAHAFSLTATPPTGAAATGRAILGDFGTGLIFNDSGAEDRNALKDDDRELKVDSPIVNEGSEHVVFRVTGISGPVELALQEIGIGTGFADLASPTLQYWNGSSWLDYAGIPLNPGTDFPSGNTLLVRVAIDEEQDVDREGAERFNLRVSGAGGPSLGTATIRDDGTGAIWLDDSLAPATPAELSDAQIVLNDDFDQDGITPTTEEALATLAASQGIAGAPGDLNGDGIADSLQSGLATLAWHTVQDFTAGNDGTLTDVEPIISLSVLSDASGNTVSDTLQLANIRVVEYTDAAEFGSASDDVTIDAITGIRRVILASGHVVTTPWDPMRFEVLPRAGSTELDDISARVGTQVRALIDVRASNLDASAFNAYIKFVSQATISAAGAGAITDLDGNSITREGWYNFTQRTPGGDGARFVVDNGKITGIELTFTDNAFGDSNVLLNRILDPGVPVLISDVRLLPTTDGQGLKVVGAPGQVLWADFSAVLADASFQNGFNLVRIRSTGERTPIGAIGATPDSGFLGDLRVQLQVGDEVRFTQVSADLPSNLQPDVTVSGEDNCIIVRLDDNGGDGDADDLVLKVKTSDTDPYPRNSQMARFQTSSEQAFLDLSWIGADGITLNVELQADAGQINTIRLVRVDTDAEGRPLGTVGGVAPTAGAAFDAKVRALALPGLSYSLTETAAASLTWQLTGAQAGVYAPVLFTDSGDVFSFGAISSSDRRQHVKVLGASSFGFEDARSGTADWDYNDAVATFNVSDPSVPRLELSRDGHGLTVLGGSAPADGLWLDLNAVLAEAGNQNGFDLFVLDASGSRSQAGSVAATGNGSFLGAKELFLGIGETLQFVQNSNDDQPNAAIDLRITKIGERYRVALEDEAATGDGDYNDFVLDVDRSPLQPCEEVVKLASLQTTSSAGLLDLSTIGAEGLKLSLAIQTESGNNNTLGFVKLDSSSANGQYSVDGVAAANSDAFRQAVRDNLIDFRVSAGGRGEAEPKVWQLVAADQGIYAAVLLTPDNEVFTFGDATSEDGRQHLKVLGDNSFGFEDLLASKGSDFDYDDFVVRITPL